MMSFTRCQNNDNRFCQLTYLWLKSIQLKQRSWSNYLQPVKTGLLYHFEHFVFKNL